MKSLFIFAAIVIYVASVLLVSIMVLEGDISVSGPQTRLEKLGYAAIVIFAPATILIALLYAIFAILLGVIELLINK
jgi:hypothetical protein